MLDVLAALVALALLALGLLVLRRRVITRGGGTFDCSLRLGEGSYGKGWVLGIGRYSGERLEWYRVFSYSMRPRRVLSRRDLQVVERRDPHGAEVFSLLSGAVVVRCLDGRRAGRARDEPGHADRVPGLGRVVAARHAHHLSGWRRAPTARRRPPGWRTGRARTAGPRAG